MALEHLLETLSLGALAIYGAAIIMLACYAMHSLWLLSAFVRRRRRHAASVAREAASPLPTTLPIVLVQLPVFNERDVVTRIVEAAGRLRWPADRLRIQLLDDSTDDSVLFGQRAIAALAARGLDATWVHRSDRTGFKAGALDHGLALDAARPDGAASFVAIFDADFVPAADFLERAIRPFLADPQLALVQGRWEHFNRDHDGLTRAQAVGIDAHFAIEQGARAWSGLPMNFNGTCGMWRVAAISAAGGWEHDTLTEDMDLSYRAQLAGWRCTYRLDLAVPGEIPTTVAAWRAQQFRWAKGSIQTARKLLPRVWRSGWSLRQKLAATFHTTHYLVHPLIVVSLIVAPLAYPALRSQPSVVLTVGAVLFLIGVATPLTLYVASQIILRGWHASRYLRDYPRTIAIGTGLAISNTRAVWQALRGQVSPFVRTPKQGDRPTSSYRAAAASGTEEVVAAGWATFGALLGASGAHPWLGGVLAIYAIGFAWMGLRIRRERDIPLFAPQNGRLGWAPVLGAALVAGMGALVVVEKLGGGWREEPKLAAGIGLALGAVYLLAIWVFERRPPGRAALLVICVVAVAIRMIALPLAASDDVNRYIVEGMQVAAGENPYVVAPADSALRSELPANVVAAVNHPTWTAIYPPGALLLEGALVHVAPSPLGFKLVMLIAELIGLFLVLGLLTRRGAPLHLIVAAAWCPLAPIWGAGEGHHDVAMATLLVAGLLAASTGRPGRGLVLATVATLIKPFAAVGAWTIALRARWWHWLAAGVMAALAYVPFAGAGTGLFSSLGRFGSEMHFHGVLEPLVRSLVGDSGSAARATPLILGGIWVTASLVISWVAVRRRVSPVETTIALFVVLLVCAPTLHPWYLAPLALLAPLTRSWALRVWLATAPVYWLHAVAFDGPGGWAEVGWVTALAHVPAALVLVVEQWRSRTRAQEPDARLDAPATIETRVAA
ncbi:MAG: glycosyltransferase family 2 protein [Kofleriaceae bacterium]